jgi:hypothetical protein
MPVGEAAEFVLTVRAERRGRVGLLLGGLFEHLPEQLLAATQELFFQMAEILVGRAERVVKFCG